MREKVINVARDFSRFPAGRFRADGQFSGEQFRERHLVSALKDADRVRVELDGTAGYGSSFLEEAFGGLVRSGQFTPKVLQEKLVLITRDESLKQEILEYLSQAVAVARH